MGQWLNNPLTYVLALAVGGLIVRGLFWLRDVHNAKEGWGAVVTEIRDDIKNILLLIQPSVTSGSPLKLTATGERMAENIQAKQWAARLAPTVRHEVEGKPPFRIDEFSQRYVESRLTPEMSDEVARCAYEFGVRREHVLSVLRVVLRDELLKPTG